MDNRTIATAFTTFSTAFLCDAMTQVRIPHRIAPTGIRALDANDYLAGRVLPVKHRGSVDVFLEALDGAEEGDVMVVDNQGRLDEGCLGTLVTHEASDAGLAGIIIWGCHRNTTAIREVGLPLFSYGPFPSGPHRDIDSDRTDSVPTIRFGDFRVTREEVVFADEDGVCFIRAQHLEKVFEAARALWHAENRQVKRLSQGESLRQQFDFDEYLRRREQDAGYTLHQHLAGIIPPVES